MDDDKKFNFFAYLNRLKYIDRWNLMRVSSREDVAQHSFITAFVSHALGLIDCQIYKKPTDANLCTTLAIYHETAEVITGDAPTPIKYGNSALTKAFKEAEREAELTLLSSLPNELSREMTKLVIPPDSREKELLKFADKITAYIKCMEEESCGNKEFENAKNTIKKVIDNFEDKTVNYFMEKFIPSFGLNLDQLMESK